MRLGESSGEVQCRFGANSDEAGTGSGLWMDEFANWRNSVKFSPYCGV